ncbi:MAG: hypothetical protein QXP53_01500 [Candidatus Pacearchaeota archaeon]
MNKRGEGAETLGGETLIKWIVIIIGSAIVGITLIKLLPVIIPGLRLT